MFPQSDGLYLVADRTRLKQILLNLLSNAIKYNRDGGTIFVSCAPAVSGHIRITVQDTGMGLRPEQMDQLFQPFNRLGQETGAEDGTGIGLVVTKRLVELMGGAIGVTSTVDVGSAFWIELKATNGACYQIANNIPLIAAQPQVAQKNMPQRTVLYVEDNPANLKLIQVLIAFRNDLRLLTAVDANLGIELARLHQPEVILMDINLPGMSGNEALIRLRTDPATAHIPVIALTANAMPRDVAKGMALGFFRYLTKPINIDDFFAAMESALEFVKKRHQEKSSGGGT